MKIEIITTGNEILTGLVVDSNKAWISERCQMLGYEVIRHTSVGDNMDSIGEALKAASRSANCVIVSGGLGPTSDDITIEAASKAFGVPLKMNEDVLNTIREFFRRTGREMSSSNEKQAMLPENCEILPNDVGTAPGIAIKLGDAQFFFLPGVPKELYQIFEDSVMPWLAAQSDTFYKRKILRCFGLPEADFAERLKDLDIKDAEFAYQVKYPDVLLRFSAYDSDSDRASARVEREAEKVYEKIGDYIYAEGETSLEEVTGKLLSESQITVSAAESCTGGLLSSLITNVPGASDYFERGIVCYSNESKMQLLGVSQETLRANGAVSRETAMAMAEGVRRISGTTLGVSLTGIAGPGGSTTDKPVGTVHIGLATPEGTDAYHYIYARDRIWFKKMAAATALDVIRRYIIQSRG